MADTRPQGREVPKGHEVVAEAPVRLMMRTSYPSVLFVMVEAATATMEDGTDAAAARLKRQQELTGAGSGA